MIESGNVLRVARKRWRCHSTGAAAAGLRWAERLPVGHTDYIEPGARYVESMDGAPGYQSGDRYCLACARAFCGWHPESQGVDAAELSGDNRPMLGGHVHGEGCIHTYPDCGEDSGEPREPAS